MDPNYIPKLQPDLLNFTFVCDSTGRYPQQGYNIKMELGIDNFWK